MEMILETGAAEKKFYKRLVQGQVAALFMTQGALLWARNVNDFCWRQQPATLPDSAKEINQTELRLILEQWKVFKQSI